MKPSRAFRLWGLLSGAAVLAVLVALAGGFSLAAAQGPTDAQLQEGALLYQENCLVCHGENGQGRVGATLAQDWPSIRPDLQIESTIRNGIPNTVMPAWDEEKGGPLNDAQIEALVFYILSWQTGGVQDLPARQTPTARPPIEPVPNVEGDPNKGAALFDLNCVVCHGPNGLGRQGANLAKSWSSIRPDLEIRSVIEHGVEGSTMPAWSQDHGGPLSEAEINDLTAFVVSLPKVQPGISLATSTPQGPPSPFRGWSGVLLLGVLFVAIIAAIWLLQRRTT
jgi:mono/diheme cytochrome c family protein